MDTSKLKKFAQAARQELLEQVGSKLAFVLKPESPTRREYPAVVNELEKAMSAHGKAALIDQVAYTWFNRFCALRFMDVNGYNRVGVVSPAEGQVQPEILAEAKSGVIDDDQINAQTTEKIRGLLNGSIPSPDAQSEAYRLLIVGSCNALYDRMPYLFERIQDYTELLMPDDLLSDNSILTKMREVMTPESCTDVEVIGWLYQFYISEKKDEVFAGLKKNQKITAENIPAATQLFTPHWIVRYLVENSLGRLWMLNRPNSKLTEQMEYYIAPEEPESNFLKINSPEEIKIADPAAGSGHMLTYAFDLLYAIYEEEGYDPNDIPALILSNNLYGIEIDERAGALASFALEMKAAAKLGRRRFFRMEAKPNVCVLEDVTFTDSEMDDVMSIVGKDLYSADLRETLTQFEQAENFGSLIVPKLKDPAETLRLIETKDLAGDMWLTEVHERLVRVLRMAEYLSPKYHVVVANPPYMAGKGMNGLLAEWLKDNYSDVKSDLFSAFIYRITILTLIGGEVGILAPYVWMFISSYQKLREFLLGKTTITSLIQLEYNAFEPAMIPVAAFTLTNFANPRQKGAYIKLSEFKGHNNQAPKTLEAIQNPDCGWFYRASVQDFGKIPGSPVAYWRDYSKYFEGQLIRDIASSGGRCKTHDDNKYVRFIWEINSRDFDSRWMLFEKGGDYRRWYGNHYYVVDWSGNAKKYYAKHGGLTNEKYWNRVGVTWQTLTSTENSFRLKLSTAQYSSVSPCIFVNDSEDDAEITLKILGSLNTKISNELRNVLNPTMQMNPGDIANLPYFSEIKPSTVRKLIDYAKEDWDSYEVSINYASPFLPGNESLETRYEGIRQRFEYIQTQTLLLEEDIEQTVCSLHGDDFSSDISLFSISRNSKLSNYLLTNELISYSIGCMFGRYSLDEPGLILANQGETLADYLARIPDPTFMPDDDNVIPLIDFEGDWFEDDISERFKQFLRVTFGDEHYAENVAFIEEALGKSIQKYFVKDFYNDHVQRYKKRPIYWLFSSPKGTFNALIYMHRYAPSTASVVLNEYLREFRTKLEARRDSNEQISISTGSSQKEKTSALKMIQKLDKAIEEVNDYEREVLYPLAGQNIDIDLDDGVKHNYPLFGSALKKVTGLS